MSSEADKPSGLSHRSAWFGLANPIGVIGGFAGLAEVAIVAAVTRTENGQQWALIVLAAAVFFYVATWFFWILWNRNWVLYPPREYSGEVGVRDYVGAMLRHTDPTANAEMVKSSIADVLKSSEFIQAVVQSLPPTGSAPEMEQTREAVTRSLIDAAPIAVEIYAERNFLNFEFIGAWEQMSPEDRSITLPYTVLGNDAIAMLYLLARIALSASQESDALRMRDFVFHYGKTWAVRNKATGAPFHELLDLVTRYRAGLLPHPVGLHVVGIQPGMALEVVTDR